MKLADMPSCLGVVIYGKNSLMGDHKINSEL